MADGAFDPRPEFGGLPACVLYGDTSLTDLGGNIWTWRGTRYVPDFRRSTWTLPLPLTFFVPVTPEHPDSTDFPGVIGG